jgi:hypothetical protein
LKGPALMRRRAFFVPASGPGSCVCLQAQTHWLRLLLRFYCNQSIVRAVVFIWNRDSHLYLWLRQSEFLYPDCRITEDTNHRHYCGVSCFDVTLWKPPPREEKIISIGAGFVPRVH